MYTKCLLCCKYVSLVALHVLLLSLSVSLYNSVSFYNHSLCVCKYSTNNFTLYFVKQFHCGTPFRAAAFAAPMGMTAKWGDCCLKYQKQPNNNSNNNNNCNCNCNSYNHSNSIDYSNMNNRNNQNTTTTTSRISREKSAKYF